MVNEDSQATPPPNEDAVKLTEDSKSSTEACETKDTNSNMQTTAKNENEIKHDTSKQSKSLKRSLLSSLSDSEAGECESKRQCHDEDDSITTLSSVSPPSDGPGKDASRHFYDIVSWSSILDKENSQTFQKNKVESDENSKEESSTPSLDSSTSDLFPDISDKDTLTLQLSYSTLFPSDGTIEADEEIIFDVKDYRMKVRCLFLTISLWRIPCAQLQNQTQFSMFREY